MSVYDCASVSECEKDRGVEQIVICLLNIRKDISAPARMGNFEQVFSSFGASSNSKRKRWLQCEWSVRSLTALIVFGSLTPFENLALDFSYGCKDHRGTKSCFPCIFTSSSNYIFIFHLS